MLIGTLLFLFASLANSKSAKLLQQLELDLISTNVVRAVQINPITIKYDNNVEVNLGNELTPTQVKNAPMNISWPYQPGAFYTLILTNPDAPSRQNPLFSEVLHWMVINIYESDLSKGQTIVEYKSSDPPEASGLHRYVFLVFEQPGQLTLDDNDKKRRENRYRFNTSEFITKYNLSPLVAGNFFQSQADDYSRQQSNFRVSVAMQAYHVVPDLIDSTPAAAAMIQYPNGNLVLWGTELTPTQTKDIPAKMNWPTEPNTLYSLIFCDPDVPSRANPYQGPFIHWLVVNIPQTDVAKGVAYVQYMGPGPAQGSGLHRYVFLMYKQPGMLTLNRTRIGSRQGRGRFNFNVRQFASENNLGNAVAGNFFQAQYDDYVPILMAQIDTTK